MTTTWANPRWKRLLFWALRLPSPAKAVLVAAERKPLLERRVVLDAHGDVVGIEPLYVAASDGLVSLREAWTGKIDASAAVQVGSERSSGSR